MALYYLNDHGNVIYRDSDQKVYEKVGTRDDVSPNASFQAADVADIQPFTYSDADNQSRVTYSAEEMAVMENLHYLSMQIDVTGEYQTVWASAPVSGVIRSMFYMSGDYWSNSGRIRINGGTVENIYSNNLGVIGIRSPNCSPLNVAQGDLVEATYMEGTPATMYIGIIPFVYP